MISRSLLVSLLIALPFLGSAQMMSEKSALKSIRLARYEKANKQVRKILSKDSTNAVAHYLLSLYFFSPQNSGYNIDSAYRYTITSLNNFSNAPIKNRERLRRFPLDSAVLTTLRTRIDSAAFVRARNLNTEGDYTFFLTHFQFAQERLQAETLRHEAAFRDAASQNTFEAFRSFIDRYPQAQQADDAKIRYEKLLYDHKTRSKRIEDYQTFIQQYPASPHRDEAIEKIFQIRTASGEVSDYQYFIKHFPDHLLRRKAEAILDHLEVTDADSAKSPATLLLIPILHQGKYGFMNALGAEVIEPRYDDIPTTYKCGNVTDELLIADGSVVSIEGYPFQNLAVDDLEPLGNGYWLVSHNDCQQVVHQSGFSVGDKCIDDAKIICGKYLAIRKESAWTLWAMNGLRISNLVFDDIVGLGEVMLFQKGTQHRLATTHTVAVSTNQQPLKLSDPFDEFKAWPHHRIWLKAGKFEGVMDQSLNTYIEFEEGTLEPTFFGARRSHGTTQLYDEHGKKTLAMDDAQIQKPWVLAKVAQHWHFVATTNTKIDAVPYDSLHFEGPFVIAARNDTTTVFFDANTRRKLARSDAYQFIPGQDSSAFLVITTPKNKTLFNRKGKKIFEFEGDKIQHAGLAYFIVAKKDKKGLIGPGGKKITPVEFDAIGSLRDGSVSLLKSMRFGLFDLKHRDIIPTEYAKNVTKYNAKFLTAFKRGGWGFFDWKNKPIGKFEFEEIQYWNDSLALVKKNAQWTMLEVESQRPVIEGIKSIKFIRNTPEEKLAIIEHDKKFGVVSNRDGTVIPINFSDLVNVGSAEDPVFFTEKHVEEASVFVVIYYSSQGKFLRKEVYEADDYEKIYCNQ